MIDNTSLLLQVIGLLTIIAEPTGGGGPATDVNVLNPSTNYALETTQQTSIDRLADILTQLQGTLLVEEQNPITGFNLEATQQDILTQLQDLLIELQKSKDFELDYFIDEDEGPGTPEFIVYRESLYDVTTDIYTYNYYKLNNFGVKIPFDVGDSSGIINTQSLNLSYLGEIYTNVLKHTSILTDYSSTITTLNVSQQIRTANPNRKYLLIQNISDTDMYINFGADATLGAGSIKLVPNGSYELSTTAGGYMTTQAVNIICSTTGKEFTAKEA